MYYKYLFLNYNFTSLDPKFTNMSTVEFSTVAGTTAFIPGCIATIDLNVFPNQTYWYKDGKVFRNATYNRNENSFSPLVFDQVFIQDAGTYQCAFSVGKIILSGEKKLVIEGIFDYVFTTMEGLFVLLATQLKQQLTKWP